MRGHKLACVTGELSTEPHSLYIIFDRFFFWQHMAGNRENGSDFELFSDCIIHQATGLGLARVPRAHRCLMAWQVVSRLSSPNRKGFRLLDRDSRQPQDTQRIQDSGFRIQRGSSRQLRLRLEMLLAGQKRCEDVNETAVHSHNMTTWPEDRAINITGWGE